MSHIGSIHTTASRTLLQLAWLTAVWTSGVRGAEPPPIAHQVHQLESGEISESSGLSAARRGTGWLFTHNDSGDSARFFAFDGNGRHRGTWEVAGADAVDWESMSAIDWHGEPALVLADIGDNGRSRRTCQLYIVSEPSRADEPARLLQSFTFRYEDGPRDAEAIAAAGPDQLLVVTKQWPIGTAVYALSLPVRSSTPVIARRVATIAAPMVTGMDISPAGDQLALVNYAFIYIYDRQRNETWEAAFARPPRQFLAPERKQGEAISYSPDGRYLYLTSEGRPAAFFRCGPLAGQ